MIYTDLTKTTSRIINPGTEYIVYFDVETADEPLDHGTGGKTFLESSEYTGTVWTSLNGAATPPLLRVITRHEDTAGAPQEVTSTADVLGDVSATVLAVPITGSVPSTRRLTVVLYNPNAFSITVSKVQVRILSQAL